MFFVLNLVSMMLTWIKQRYKEMIYQMLIIMILGKNRMLDKVIPWSYPAGFFLYFYVLACIVPLLSLWLTLYSSTIT